MLEPLQDEFMRRAIAEIALIGLAGGALGCWVVLYELSYAAESLAHSLFPGLVLAALAGIPLLLGATPAILVAALAIALAARAPGTSRDVAVAVVITTMFGLGVLLALSPASPPGIEALLFGDVLGPSDSDLLAAGTMAVAIPLSLWALHPRLLASGFDRDGARALGLSPRRVEALLLILLAAATVVSVQGLGNLLVVAVLVGPAAAARRLTDRIVPMLVLAAAIAVLAGVAGLYASYYLGTAGGASVALAMFVAYLLCLPIGRLRGRRGLPEPAQPRATIA